jgi:endonuclease/exonuclease/phosphatase family metal-dependent hydrolase
VGKVPGEQLTVASLNTRGIPLTGSRLASRYETIGRAFEAGEADVVCFQEVFTYWHLRLLARRMVSFTRVSYRPSPAGPAGGLVTFSRRPVSSRPVYRGFGFPPEAPGIPRLIRLRASGKGALVTRLGRPELRVINTHPVANWDGDWSESNRFYPLHRAQLDVLTRVIDSVPPPAIVCGDFNIDRGSSLFTGFLAASRLADAFDGSCPPTFRAEFLPPGEVPHCIDFILTKGGIRPVAATVLFTGKQPLPGAPGYVSDHLGLSASLVVAPA